MLQFMTAIPIPINLKVDNEDFGKGLVFAPIAGLAIGALLSVAYLGISAVFPVNVAIVMVIVIYIIITGGLHLDGLGDTFDGLFSNRSKERMLEIMRDSRVGTNAVLAVISIILLNVTLLTAFDGNIVKVFLLMPVAGRIGSLVGAGSSVYARSGEGLGKSFIDFCGFKEICIGLIPYFIIFYAILGLNGLYISLIPVATAYITVKYLSRKIGGATGDILGAVCELNQTFFLIVICILKYNLLI